MADERDVADGAGLFAAEELLPLDISKAVDLSFSAFSVAAATLLKTDSTWKRI